MCLANKQVTIGNKGRLRIVTTSASKNGKQLYKKPCNIQAKRQGTCAIRLVPHK